jgi:GntR family transcriptional repressor for pyruvate dehydrogenase complex
MAASITPISKQSLPDNLAQELKNFILGKGYLPGHKLPSTAELAQRFGVGLPTLREAIKKLEASGAIEVKHGSGIYVGEHIDSLFLINPIVSNGAPTKKQLLDLIDARIPIELSTSGLAARNATQGQIDHMDELLHQAGENFENDAVLNDKNMAFHNEIARASGNVVFHQILSVIVKLFQKEQRLLIDIFHGKKLDHRQHLEIFAAIKKRNEKKAVQLMRSHLIGVRKAILRWAPKEGGSNGRRSPQDTFPA